MVNRLLTTTNIPKMFRTTMYTDYDSTRGRPDILNRLQAWKPSDSNPSALFAGPPGLGKTMLACAAINETHSRCRFKTVSCRSIPDDALLVVRQQRAPVYFIQLSEFIALHIRLIRLQARVDRGTIDPMEYEEIEALLEDLKDRVKLLVVDDVGKEHRTGSGFAEDEFDLLVRTRHNRGLATIYTSNIPLEQWSDQYSESLQNLIQR